MRERASQKAGDSQILSDRLINQIAGREKICFEELCRISGSCDNKTFSLPEPTHRASNQGSNQGTGSAEPCLCRARGLVISSPGCGTSFPGMTLEMVVKKASSDQRFLTLATLTLYAIPSTYMLCGLMKTKSARGKYCPLTFRGGGGGIGTSWIDCTYRLRHSVKYIVTTNQVDLLGTMELVSKQKRRVSNEPLGS